MTTITITTDQTPAPSPAQIVAEAQRALAQATTMTLYGGFGRETYTIIPDAERIIRALLALVEAKAR